MQERERPQLARPFKQKRSEGVKNPTDELIEAIPLAVRELAHLLKIFVIWNIIQGLIIAGLFVWAAK